jgi:hypothetical protein
MEKSLHIGGVPSSLILLLGKIYIYAIWVWKVMAHFIDQATFGAKIIGKMRSHNRTMYLVCIKP